MNDKLQNILNMVSRNYQTASAFYKMDYNASFAAFGITNADREADPDKIAEAKQIIKEKAGIFSVFGSGAPRMMAISKMVRSTDPLETFNKIISIYDTMKKVFNDSAFVGVMATLLIDYPKDIGELSVKSSERQPRARLPHLKAKPSSPCFPRRASSTTSALLPRATRWSSPK